MTNSYQESDLLEQESLQPQSQDFKTRQLDQLLAERIDKAFHKETSQICFENLAKIAEEHSPIDLAYAASMLPTSLRPILFQNFLSLDRKIDFLINTDNCTKTAIFRYITDQEIKVILEEAPAADVVDLLDTISEKKYRKILEIIDPNKAEAIKELKAHSRNSAGRLMTSEFFAFKPNKTVGQACEIIKNNPGVEFTRRVFVVDEHDILTGVITARHLIVNGDQVKLKEVMRPAVHVVKPETTREEVIDTFQRYKISGLPVVDDTGVLLGVISQDDVIEAMEDISDATIACMAGTGEKVSESEPFFKRFLCRAPWLFVTLLAGLLNMSIMNVFQNTEGIFLTFVFFFVPLVTGMSGNIGLQCSTILVRNMALGLLSKDTQKEIIIKETILGLFTGGAFGVLSGFLVFLLNLHGLVVTSISAVALGVIVSVGVFGACISGTLLGVLSPMFFSRIGIDPAVSAGPIVTAFNDFLSMTIYFLIALGLSNLLL